jgi:hypothetical protein
MSTADYCPTFTLQTYSCREILDLPKGYIPVLPTEAEAFESTSHNARCIPTVNGKRPVCLEAACDKAHHVIKLKAGKHVITCSYDFEEHLLPGTDITISCPRLLSLCPETACPANCSGQGVCDYSSKVPKCKCNDPMDTTEGCFKSFVVVPPRTRQSSSKYAFVSGGSIVSGWKVCWIFLAILIAVEGVM